MIDLKKIKIVEAEPQEPVRIGTGTVSPLTQLIVDLLPGRACLVPTGGGNEHKIAQRNVNARIKSVKRIYPDREYVTRTLKPGDKAGSAQIREVILGIYRTK